MHFAGACMHGVNVLSHGIRRRAARHSSSLLTPYGTVPYRCCAVSSVKETVGGVLAVGP